MKQLLKKVENDSIYKRLMKEPLTYVAGAVLLAVLQTAHFSTLGSTWGITTTFAFWGGWLAEAVGIDVSSWSFFATEENRTILEAGILHHGGSFRNMGLVAGALTATLFASQFKFKKIKSKKQVVAAIFGGLLMGYSARMAAGCNIGALFTAIISLSLSGWIFGICLFMGAFIGSKLLIKFFI